MLKLSLAALCAALLCPAPALAVSFYDDFESGNMANWTQYPGSAAALAISTDHNIVPGAGQYSAKQDALVAGGNGIASYHYFGQTTGPLTVEAYIYDDFTTSADPVQGAITLQTDDGSGTPNFSDYLRLGILQFSGQNADYAFRTAADGFIDTGVARKQGWTKLGIQVDSGVGGQARFYIDDALVGTSTRVDSFFSVVTIGQNFSDYQYFYYDGVSVVPEPTSMLLLCLGGLVVGGIGIRRRRRA